MEPLGSRTVLDVLKVRIPESWFMLLRRKKIRMNFIDFSSKFLISPVTELGFTKGFLTDASVRKPLVNPNSVTGDIKNFDEKSMKFIRIFFLRSNMNQLSGMRTFRTSRTVRLPSGSIFRPKTTSYLVFFWKWIHI